MNKVGVGRLLAGWLGLVVVVACSPTPVPAPPPLADWQATVEAMAALVAPLSAPDHLMQKEAARQAGDFDPNMYFTVLDHLSIEPGYTLDYVYYYDFWAGLPLLYARPAGQAPYQTYTEYALAFGDNLEAERDAYLEHVRADGSAAGFFQLVVLRIMGGQFYLVWHAHYSDATILSSREALEALIARFQGMDVGYPLSDEAAQQARALDPTPVVEIGAEEVRVQVLVFSRWSGFSRETYTLSRDFPHRLLQMERQTPVPYDCGIRF